MTRDQIVRLLEQRGVPGTRASAIAVHYAEDLPTVTTHRFEIPWAKIVSDNLHVSPVANRATWRAYRDRRDAMREACRAQAAGAPLAGPCSLEVTLQPPDRRRRDAANVLKALCDALKGVAYADDSQLVLVTVCRAAPDRLTPRATVIVRPVPDPRAP